jgi:hypothetical protein
VLALWPTSTPQITEKDSSSKSQRSSVTVCVAATNPEKESGSQRVQRKEALMDENLPEEYRIELAKAFVNDLFAKVKPCAAMET